MRRIWIAALLVAVAAPAGAAAQYQKREHNRLVVTPDQKTAQARPKATAPSLPLVAAEAPPTDPDLVSPSLSAAVAPRLGGIATPRSDGADCRTACARDQYMCLAQDEQDRCNATWGQCVAACPAQSGDSP